MATVVRATPAHRAVLLGSDVFDGPVRADLLDEVLADPRHHLFLAVDGAACFGFVSGVHYLHPDKEPQMWINELGVNADHRRKGLATRLVVALADHARRLGCESIWVLADPTLEAMSFYAALGWTQTGTDIAMFSRDLSDLPG